MNVRPDVFFAGDRSPNLPLLESVRPIDQGTFISTSGIGTYPAASVVMTDLCDRITLAALGFFLFQVYRTPEPAHH